MISIETLMEILKIIVSVSIFFVWFVRYDNIKKEFLKYQLPSWLRDIVGILKISFCIMIHSNDSNIVIVGAVGILILMLGAAGTHIKMKSKFNQYIASVVMLLISILILYYAI